MNKTYKTLFALIVLFTISFTACKKDDETTTPEDPKVNFSFTNPEAGKMYDNGDTVHMDGMISWENEMHGYEITLTNTSMDSVVFSKHEHEDGNTFHIHEAWKNNVMHHSDMKLTIDALTDHDGAKETKEIIFHCHPM